MKIPKAFTLVEILIVIVILGILAAVVIPSVAHNTLSAKDSALAMDLQLLRRIILVYKIQHLEVGPGYPNGDTNLAPTEQDFIDQTTMSSNTNSQTAAIGTHGFNRGPYLMKIPANPFNGLNTVEILADAQAFPANADDSHGWIYKAATSEVRADSTGTNKNGKRYYDF